MQVQSYLGLSFKFKSNVPMYATALIGVTYHIAESGNKSPKRIVFLLSSTAP